MFISEGTGMYNPIILANAYDALINPALASNQKINKINQTMVKVMIIFLVGTVAGFVRQVIQTTAGERLVARLRNKLYASILKQEVHAVNITTTHVYFRRHGHVQSHHSS